MSTPEMPILNVHTPSSSFAIVHSYADDTFPSLCEKLSKKIHTEYSGHSVGPGWLKYSWNNTIWNLDDESDYTIFAWRQKTIGSDEQISPQIFLHDPDLPLPAPSAYRNPSYYVFQQARAEPSSPPLKADGRSARSVRSRKPTDVANAQDQVPKHKKEFDKFHSENGVRTIQGSIGPINNVRMLLKEGYRHVYISRKFALRHGFIPGDAAPGHYGYGGLVNIGTWPIMVGRTRTTHTVYLSEESHFDVVLGRSFMEKRQVKTDPIDPTDVMCMDTGEKIDCELVILKDGKGQIVTVT